ncbi:MAG: protein phosphatase 2C domain-containing protein [Proteobacteria bacterium]|nr:protein phosphatase 2C domain-containing protein [Pseudomonadota bacterium]
MIKVESAGITDTGRKRPGNEDSYFVDESNCLYVVADGMGGHNAGEVASKLVVDTLKEMMGLYVCGDTDKIKSIQDVSIQASWLLTSVAEANKRVYRLSKKESACKGMGSTVSAVFVVSDKLIALNVGDSPIYLFRNNEIDMLSVPHTAMAEYAAFAPAGAQPLSERFRHTITRAIGIKKEVEPDFREIKIFTGDQVLVCSDGLSDKVKPEEIMDIMKNNSALNASRMLVDLANERGGDDNITLIALNITDDLQAQTKPGFTKTHANKNNEILRQLVVEYDTDDISNRVLVEDITMKGFFLETGEIFSMGQNIILTISDETEENSVMVNAKIVERRPVGVKLEFDKLTPDQKKKIKSLIDK